MLPICAFTPGSSTYSIARSQAHFEDGMSPISIYILAIVWYATTGDTPRNI